MYKQPENQAYEVPLCERLDAVPHNARLIIEDDSGLGTSYIPIGVIANLAAAELRRLHQSESEGWRWAKECEAEVKRLKEIIDELENDDQPSKPDVNQELVEALKQVTENPYREGTSLYEQVLDIGRAAIAKATGEQA